MARSDIHIRMFGDNRTSKMFNDFRARVCAISGGKNLKMYINILNLYSLPRYFYKNLLLRKIS